MTVGWLAFLDGRPVTDAYGNIILFDHEADAILEGHGVARPVVDFAGWGPDTR